MVRRVVVAAGTLIAVGYAALNSDLRGRAELNKTASLACRTALHASTTSMLACADAPHRMQDAARTALGGFPTAAELEQLTGRTDLEWRVTGLLPRGAGVLSHRHRGMPVLRTPLVQDVAAEVLGRPRTMSKKSRSLITEGDVRDEVRALDDGFTGKLDRVLGRTGTAQLEMLDRGKSGKTAARSLYALNNQPALARVDRDALDAEWAAYRHRDPDDPGLRKACRVLHRHLRTFVDEEHRRHWLVAVAEYRLQFLAQTVDKSLSPRLFERVRQAFGK